MYIAIRSHLEQFFLLKQRMLFRVETRVLLVLCAESAESELPDRMNLCAGLIPSFKLVRREMNERLSLREGIQTTQPCCTMYDHLITLLK